MALVLRLRAETPHESVTVTRDKDTGIVIASYPLDIYDRANQTPLSHQPVTRLEAQK
jgi:hypothetical protein